MRVTPNDGYVEEQEEATVDILNSVPQISSVSISNLPLGNDVDMLGGGL